MAFDFDKRDDEEFLINVDADLNPLYVGSYVHVFDQDVFGTILGQDKGDGLLIVLDEDIDEQPYLVISDEVRIAER
jgi:hypothetical protein